MIDEKKVVLRDIADLPDSSHDFLTGYVMGIAAMQGKKAEKETIDKAIEEIAKRKKGETQ